MARKKGKGRSRKVPCSRQGSLFGWRRKARRQPGAKGKLQFEDPRPEEIWIGEARLRDLLEETGQQAVVAVRRHLRGMDWKALTGEYEGGGRRPYHPASLLGLVLFGIMEGKSSLRQLETLARCDVRCWWLTGGIFPDHSVVGRFLNRHRDYLSEEFFEELTRGICQRLSGGGASLAVDGTLVQAAASRYRRVQREAAEQQAEEARRKADSQPEDEKLQKKAEAAERARETVRRRQKARRAQGKSAEGVAVSPSEPEAVIQPIKEKFTVPAYRPSVVAREDRVIVAQGVDPKSETEILGGLLSQARRVSGDIEELLCDPGYFQIDALAECRRQEVGEVLCPPGPHWDEERRQWSRRSSRQGLPKSQFRYDERQDCYWCPAGERLDRKGSSRDRGRCYDVYGGADCSACQLRGQCTTNPRGRRIKRYEGEELKEKLAARMKEEEARQRYGRRKWMVEPVFGELKHIQGLQRFRRRGLARVRLEFSLHAMAHNLRRLLALPEGLPDAFSSLLGNGLRALRAVLRLLSLRCRRTAPDPRFQPAT